MAKTLDARAAAQEIRGKMQQPSAEERHVNAFVDKVLDELGMEHTAPNSVMVARALQEADIRPHEIVEYPKAVTVKVTYRKKYGDDEEHDVVHVVHDEDEEQRVLGGEQPGAARSEYPKSIRVRGTDGNWRNQIVRDLKEEREFLGVGVSAIDPEASTQYKKAMLEHPTQDEIDVAKVTSKGGEMQKEALDNVNAPKVGGGTNVSNPPDTDEAQPLPGEEQSVHDGVGNEPYDHDHPEQVEGPVEDAAPPKPAPAPAPRASRPPPRRA